MNKTKTAKKPKKLGRGRYVTSKIGKTKALEASATLRKYIPITKRMNHDSLQQMLKQYKMVYVKPNVGMFGNGVIRVEWADNSSEKPYSYQSGVRLRKFATFDEMYAAMGKVTNKRHYLVQRGFIY
nr:YheC/YheD family protein [Paenibacillus sp. N3.4]